MIQSKLSTEFKEGIRLSIPIFLSYFSISITFGLIAKSLEFNGFLAVLMSVTNFTGATQFISVNMLSNNLNIFNIIFTMLIINTRYLLMSFCVANKFSDSISKKLKFLISFGVTDEIFVLSVTRDKLHKDFILGSQAASYSGWVLGTIVGIVLAGLIPKSITDSASIAIYIMFLNLLIPAVSKSKNILFSASVAMFFSSIFHYIPLMNKLIGNWRIILSIILASTVSAFLFPITEEV